MKDNTKAQFVNELRDASIKYKDCQCLREVLSKVVSKYIPKINCDKCKNRGQILGLSQESYCSHCIYSGKDYLENYYEETK